MRFTIPYIVLVISSYLAAAAVIERQTGGIITCTCLNDVTLRAAQAESQDDSTYTCYYGSSDRHKADSCTYNQILGNLVSTNMKHCNTLIALPCF